ncbi:MAG: hypothetical protein DRO99_01125 [Candidatus Aenigmatarchaeota archaeon]|nr:MAG: hypothetical protein DRO99_01125 [Candidatus Aenigmarchaeota archaeon]
MAKRKKEKNVAAYAVFSVILVIAVSSIIMQYTGNDQSTGLSEDEKELESMNTFQAGDVMVTPIVRGCATGGSNNDALARSKSNKERRPSVTVHGDTIIYDRAISHLCCRIANVELTGPIENGRIDIYETWSGPECRCMCFSELGMKLSNLAPGDYTVNVHKSGFDANGMPLEDELIVAEEVRIA